MEDEKIETTADKPQDEHKRWLFEKITRIYEYCVEQWDDRFEAIKKNNSMYSNDQWDSDDKEKLEKQGRPALCINIEWQQVNQLVGTAAATNGGWKVTGVDNKSDDQIADVLNKLLMHTATSNDIDFVNDQVMQAGVIGGLGWYFIEMDYTDDPQGVIRISDLDNTSIYLDPDAKREDQRDWKYVLRTAWMTWSDIQDNWDTAPRESPESTYIQNEWELYKEALPAPLRDSTNLDMVDSSNNLYRVLELWEKKRERVVHIVDPLSGKGYDIPSRSKSEIAELERRGWIRQYEGYRNYLNVVVGLPYANKILAEFRVNRKYFPFFVYAPLKFAGLPIKDAFGYVELLHGLQEEKNRARSVINDALQRQALGSKILPAGEGELKKELEERGSEPSSYFERATNDGEIVDLDGNFPSGYGQLLQINAADIPMVSGQPLAMQGISESSEETGILHRQKVQQGIVTISPIFRAMTRTRRLLGKGLIEMIQTEYTQERIFRINGLDDLQNVTPEEIMINQQIGDKILNDVTIGTYDILIDEAPVAKTDREIQFRIWSETIKGFPPEVQVMFLPDLIEVSELPNRKALADKYRQLTQGMMQPQLPPGAAGGAPPVNNINNSGFLPPPMMAGNPQIQ